MLEPYSEIFEYRDEKGVLRFTNEDMDETACEQKGFTGKKPLDFRDYDQGTLKKMLDEGLENSPLGAYSRLLDRVVLPKPIVAPQSPTYKGLLAAIFSSLGGIFKKKVETSWVKRYKYDSERWYGKS